jgi:hypothetical protein
MIPKKGKQGKQAFRRSADLRPSYENNNNIYKKVTRPKGIDVSKVNYKLYSSKSMQNVMDA